MMVHNQGTYNQLYLKDTLLCMCVGITCCHPQSENNTENDHYICIKAFGEA